MIPLLSHAKKTNVWVTRYVESQVRRLRGDTDYFDGGSADLLAGTIVPNQWYAVLEADRVGEQPEGIRRLGENLVLWRDGDGRLGCSLDRCPHRGSKLSLGQVRDGDLECPYHGFRFDSSGGCTLIPANGPDSKVPAGLRLRTRPVVEAHGLIWVWWGAPRSEYPEIPWFPQSEDDERHAASRSGLWKFHYSRAIENSLDAHHFPFVHGSLNPNGGTFVAPFSAEEDAEGVINVEAGLKRRASDPDEDALMFRMRMKFPNVIHVDLTDHLHLIQIATPIDDERTWMYVRYYQGYVRLPVVGSLVTKALLTGDWFIAQEMQDIPIFKTQQPKVPGMDVEYSMIRADRGIILYLRKRDALIAAAGEPPTELRAARESAS